jgi:phenylalanyl-tRNA synthetase beta chain
MKVSLNWLRDYVDVIVPLDDLAERLTMAGLEVEEMQTIGDDWSNIVIGQIIGVDAHPNADRLRLASVNLGDRQTSVVCGAPNLNVGDKIAFASIGAWLRDGHSDEMMELKPAKIRGVLSEGMVCSEKELGISDNHEGILILPSNAPIGLKLAEYFGDTVLDISVTPNRPDCLSVIGIAREIAALTGSKLHIPDIDYAELENPIGEFASVEIVEPVLCPRYCAAVMTGIEIGSSPHWMQQRLIACGMRPISNIVDITNYVMLEYGQPLHAFDCNKVNEQRIIVRKGIDGETMTTLDGIERKLNRGTLVIADPERAIAVAGVMGGASTEITPDTCVVLLESANFNQATVHDGSISLKLSSEASLRFEKGLSPELAMIALRRAVQLMVELTGAKVAKGLIDVYPGQQSIKPILFPNSEIKRLLGVDVAKDEMVKSLELLGFICNSTESSEQIEVTIPWWRTDISCAADLVEEVARIIGYDNIPVTMLSASLPVHDLTPFHTFRQKIRSILVSSGLQDILTYALISLDVIRKLSPERHLFGPEPLKAANPMSLEQEYLRTTLRSGILSTLARNQRYQQKGVGLFEIGKVFIPRRKDLPQEKEMLCAVLGGLQIDEYWHGDTEPIDFFTAKGVAETILSQLGLIAEYFPGNDDSLYPGKNAAIVINNDTVGVVGQFHPKVISAFDITGDIFLVEFDIEKLLSITSGSYNYEHILKYPSTIRDIALLMDDSITYRQITDIITGFPLVKHVNLFDLYQGEQIKAGTKSLAFRIVYQSSTQTLSDEQVDEVQKDILDKLSDTLGVTLRH